MPEQIALCAYQGLSYFLRDAQSVLRKQPVPYTVENCFKVSIFTLGQSLPVCIRA
jgi:hypothetical protein